MTTPQPYKEDGEPRWYGRDTPTPQEDAELRLRLAHLTDGALESYHYDELIAFIKTRDEQREKIRVNRVEVIDHTDGGEGRVFTKWTDGDYQVELSEQDDGRTLKIFFTNPQQDKEEE